MNDDAAALILAALRTLQTGDDFRAGIDKLDAKIDGLRVALMDGMDRLEDRLTSIRDDIGINP